MPDYPGLGVSAMRVAMPCDTMVDQLLLVNRIHPASTKLDQEDA
jgi:hypothetical protein